jgi:hypothetical protein
MLICCVIIQSEGTERDRSLLWLSEFNTRDIKIFGGGGEATVKCHLIFAFYFLKITRLLHAPEDLNLP